MNAPILATRTIPAPHTHAYKLEFIVEGGLHYLKGNALPYFSLTYTSHRKGFPNQVWSGGAGHEEILKYYPQFSDLAALHLSDINGVPMHAEKSGWYWLAGSLGGLGEKYHGSSGYNAHTQEECLGIFAEHCRISMDEAANIQKKIYIAYERSDKELAKWQWMGYCNSMRPRWKQEAEACIRKHNLQVYGDKWEG